MIESNGDEFGCKYCKKNYRIHPYTEKILLAVNLLAGGYRFDNNHFTEEEWSDIGVIKQWQEIQQRLSWM
jgi:hypothetical protein